VTRTLYSREDVQELFISYYQGIVSTISNIV